MSGFTLSDGTAVVPCNPFFITGSGRCGTTLMRRLVVERTRAVIPPENHTLAWSTTIMTRVGSDWVSFCRLVLNEMLKSSGGGWEYFCIDVDMALRLLGSIRADCRTIQNFWHAFHAIYALRVDKPDSIGWGDKTPSNTAQLPEIIEIFPRARFVFLVRDVFDVAWSYGSMSARGRIGHYQEGATRWVHANTKILAFAEQHPSQVMMVRYEDLARYPDREMARVLGHLDVPLRAAVPLTLSEASDIMQRPHLGNVLGEVSGDFIGKGRASLTSGDRQQISAVAAALQVRLGYEPTGSWAC